MLPACGWTRHRGPEDQTPLQTKGSLYPAPLSNEVMATEGSLGAAQGIGLIKSGRHSGVAFAASCLGEWT